MRVLCSNDSSKAFRAMAKQYPDKLGWLMGPRHWKKPLEHVPYALDNDAFTAWKEGEKFDTDAWLRMIDKAFCHPIKPMWALVPDVVGNRDGTLEMWSRHWRTVFDAGFELAFAVQDGMTFVDVPADASVIFIGGTTLWKWRSASQWCRNFARVHIGRVNSLEKLWIAQRVGAESCDGSGYFRKTVNGSGGRQLKSWLHHGDNPQREFGSSLLEFRVHQVELEVK